MRDNPTKLRVWMAAQRTTARALAAQLGCSASMLSNIRSGMRRPGRRLATALERATSGEVTAAAWDAPEPVTAPAHDRDAA